MKYRDGTIVRLGDKVRPWSGCAGVVVCSVDTDEYAPGYPKDVWADVLGGGILVLTDAAGLVQFREADEDFGLLADELE